MPVCYPWEGQGSTAQDQSVSWRSWGYKTLVLSYSFLTSTRHAPAHLHSRTVFWHITNTGCFSRCCGNIPKSLLWLPRSHEGRQGSLVLRQSVTMLQRSVSREHGRSLPSSVVQHPSCGWVLLTVCPHIFPSLLTWFRTSLTGMPISLPVIIDPIKFKTGSYYKPHPTPSRSGQDPRTRHEGSTLSALRVVSHPKFFFMLATF